MPLTPTPVEPEGLFAYARASPIARRASDREVVVVGGGPPPEARPVGLSVGGSSDGWVLDVETEVHGVVRADRVAARLASLAGGRLRKASFEQITLEETGPAADASLESSERSLEPDDGRRISSLPEDASIPEGSPVVGLCRLRAGHELCAWEIVAIDRGPWLDLPAILGLLNTMLRHGQSPIRYAVLRGDGTDAHVLAGPMDLIESAVADGRIVLEGLDDALARSFGDGDSSEGVPLEDAP